MSQPVPFEIVEKGGVRVATNGTLSLVALDTTCGIFKRRGIKGAGTSAPQNIEWAVAELNGVRVYVDGSGTVVVTTQDLYP